MYMMPVLYACVGACVYVSGVCVFAFRGQRGAKESVHVGGIETVRHST